MVTLNTVKTIVKKGNKMTNTTYNEFNSLGFHPSGIAGNSYMSSSVKSRKGKTKKTNENYKKKLKNTQKQKKNIKNIKTKNKLLSGYKKNQEKIQKNYKIQ